MKPNKKEPAYKSKRDPLLMTLDEIKDRWLLHPETIRRYIRSGRLPAIRFGGHFRVPLEAVEAFESTGRPDDSAPRIELPGRTSDPAPHVEPVCGMTPRDYFAAAALQGLLASSSVGDALAEPDYAKAAYIQADAMLAERRGTS